MFFRNRLEVYSLYLIMLYRLDRGAWILEREIKINKIKRSDANSDTRLKGISSAISDVSAQHQHFSVNFLWCE